MLKKGDVIRLNGLDWEVKVVTLAAVSLKRGNYFTTKPVAELATAPVIEKTRTGIAIRPRGDLFARIYG